VVLVAQVAEVQGVQHLQVQVQLVKVIVEDMVLGLLGIQVVVGVEQGLLVQMVVVVLAVMAVMVLHHLYQAQA
jgi:hypothetical protein